MTLGLRVVAALLAWIAVSIFSGCATSPTGRKQLILLPESQMSALGAQAFAQMQQSEPTESDPSLNEYVRCVAKPILAVSESSIPADKWEIVVFKDTTANAFALPGGKVGVNTGLLKVAVNPAQLATVIGHEVGHVLARHGNERVSEGLVAQGGQAALGALLEKQTGRQEVYALLGLGMQFGILLPHSRTQESEADEIGLRLMAKAGFDPAQSIELWKNMTKQSGGSPPEFLSTHPSNTSRIDELTRMQEEVRPVYLKVVAAGRTPHCKAP
jgi:predicted Zn-dependent protease